MFALDSLARKTIADLQAESIPSRYGPPLSHRITLEEAVEGEDLGLDQRLRLDEWGALMLGQEHHFRDLLHPDVIPGSYLWGDIMLYEYVSRPSSVSKSDRAEQTQAGGHEQGAG